MARKIGGKVLLSAGETAKLLGVTRTTVYAWSKRGIFNPIRISRTLYIRKDEVDAYLGYQADMNTGKALILLPEDVPGDITEYDHFKIIKEEEEAFEKEGGTL